MRFCASHLYQVKPKKRPHPQPFPHFVGEGSKIKSGFIPPFHAMGRGLGGGAHSLTWCIWDALLRVHCGRHSCHPYIFPTQSPLTAPSLSYPKMAINAEPSLPLQRNTASKFGGDSTHAISNISMYHLIALICLSRSLKRSLHHHSLFSPCQTCLSRLPPPPILPSHK